MANLARKMGEYFLSVDLGCLLENKRKNQLDEVAKFTGLRDDIPVIESIMLDSRFKKDRDYELTSSKFMEVRFVYQEYEKNQQENAPAGLVTERHREEAASDDSGDLLYGEQVEVPLPKNSQKLLHKKQMRTYSKSIRVILNILWISLENSSYETLQNHEKLMVQLSIYMASDMSCRNRDKETLMVVLFNKKLNRFSHWNSKKDEYVQKIDNITDNVNIAKPMTEQDKMLFGKEALSPLLFGSKSKQGYSKIELIGTSNEARYAEDLSEKNIDIKRLLISEEEVIFNLVEVFSELNEKRTEFMRVNINEFFGESFIADIRRNVSPPITPMNNRGGELRSKNFSENSEHLFIPSLRGTPIINYIPPNYYFARTNTCPLLKKISMTIDILLANCPMSSPQFFPMLVAQLSLLESFLSTTSSRVIVCEVIEKILQTLICLKNIFIRMSEVDVKDFPPKQMSQKASPRNPCRDNRDQKMKGQPQLRREDSGGYPGMPPTR